MCPKLQLRCYNFSIVQKGMDFRHKKFRLIQMLINGSPFYKIYKAADLVPQKAAQTGYYGCIQSKWGFFCSFKLMVRKKKPKYKNSPRAIEPIYSLLELICTIQHSRERERVLAYAQFALQLSTRYPNCREDLHAHLRHW